MDILVHSNELLKFISTMLKQRIKYGSNNDNKGCTTGITFTMNVFDLEEVLCMSSGLDRYNASVDVFLYQFVPQYPTYNTMPMKQKLQQQQQ